MDSNYWSQGRRRFGRRTMLRGALVAGAGLGAAALVGCGSEEESPDTPAAAATSASTPPASGGTTTTSTSPAAVPANAQVPHVEGDPTYGGTFTMPTTATHAQHDMHTALGLTVWHSISGRAFELEEWTAELQGGAVEEWEILDDQGLELAMHVRPGLTIHDKEPWNGREFNAEDLAFNLERNAGLTADAEGIPLTSFQRRSMVEGLESTEVVDDRTVLIKMARPNGAIFNGLAEIRTQLMPKGIVEVGFEDPTKFASFGPFQMTEFRQGEREIYDKHPNYYREGEPYFDRYERVAIADRSSTLAAFIDKQISAIAGPLPHETETAQQVNRDSLYYEWMHTNWDHFRWNTVVPALGDFRVRKAFQLATDLKEINDGWYGPGWTYTAVTHPLYPEAWSPEIAVGLPGINPDTKEEDRAEAARLLEAAGYPNGAGIDIVIVPTATATYEEHSLRFQAQMTALFPDIQIEIQRPSDSAAFATRQAARDFSAICYTITVVPDIYLEWHSQYHTDGSRNYGSFEDPIADELIERGLRSLDQEERVEIADEFQRRFVEEWAANLVLCILPERYLVQGNIGGVDAQAGPWGFTTYRMLNKAGTFYQV